MGWPLPGAAAMAGLFKFAQSWHHSMMSKSENDRKAPKTGFVIGRERFAQISAVEGVGLSQQMLERVQQADRDGLSDQQRRETIICAHRRT